MKKYSTIILLLFVGFSLTAQDQEKFKEILTKTKAVYKNKQAFEFDMNYTLYKASDLNKAQESYSGVYAKKGDNTYSKIGAVEYLQSNSEFVQVNHEEKAMLYTKNSEYAAMQDPLNLDSFFDFFGKVSVKETATGWTCELSELKGVSQLPFAKMEITIDKNYQIRKQCLYLVQAMEFIDKGKEVLEPAILEIKFSGLKAFSSEAQLKLQEYIQKSGASVKPTGKYKNYELVQV
ncbi:MAG: hypothetical protein HRT68_10350 [Flavobacteriaceae bacterium]|nr:hypothetical protein [Flavobacteriaceae bacterium]